MTIIFKTIKGVLILCSIGSYAILKFVYALAPGLCNVLYTLDGSVVLKLSECGSDPLEAIVVFVLAAAMTMVSSARGSDVFFLKIKSENWR